MAAVSTLHTEPAISRQDMMQSAEELRRTTAELVEKAIARNLPDLEQLPSTEADLDVGTSDKELVYTEDTARLYHYDAMCDEIYRVPVLIIMWAALISPWASRLSTTLIK